LFIYPLNKSTKQTVFPLS